MEEYKEPEGEKAKVLKEKISEIYEDFDKYKKLLEFSRGLQDKYPDYSDYRFYHLLVGSTPWKDTPKDDFPGEDSVEKFVNSL